jgi:hypothetical protein
MLVVVKQDHVAGERLQYRVIIAAGCFEATRKLRLVVISAPPIHLLSLTCTPILRKIYRSPLPLNISSASVCFVRSK